MDLKFRIAFYFLFTLSFIFSTTQLRAEDQSHATEDAANIVRPVANSECPPLPPLFGTMEENSKICKKLEALETYTQSEVDIKWEKVKNKPTAMAWTSEKDLRLFVLSKLQPTKAIEIAPLYAALEKERQPASSSVDLDAKKVA